MMCLKILPVYSEHYKPGISIGSTQLLSHQVATWERYHD